MAATRVQRQVALIGPRARNERNLIRSRQRDSPAYTVHPNWLGWHDSGCIAGISRVQARLLRCELWRTARGGGFHAP
jgi:hypothetical protein